MAVRQTAEELPCRPIDLTRTRGETIVQNDEPAPLLFCDEDRAVIADRIQLLVRRGANVTLSVGEAPEGLLEVGYIAAPGSRPDAADWTFWRCTDGIRAEYARDGYTLIADDMADLLDTLLGEWAAAAEARVARLQRAAIAGLPAWLTAAEPLARRGVAVDPQRRPGPAPVSWSVESLGSGD